MATSDEPKPGTNAPAASKDSLVPLGPGGPVTAPNPAPQAVAAHITGVPRAAAALAGIPGTGVHVVRHDATGAHIEEQRREASSTPEGDAHRRLIARDTLVGATVVTCLLLVVILCLYSIRVLLAGFAGILFSVVLQALTDLIRWVLPSLRRGFALFLAIVLIVGIVGGLTSVTASRVAEQAQDLETRLPQSLTKIDDYLSAKPWGKPLVSYFGQLREQVGSPAALATNATGVVASAVGVLLTLIIVTFVGIFIAANPPYYRTGVLSLFPKRHRPVVSELMDELNRVLRRWLVGQLIDMIFVGLFTYLGLLLLGVPLALLIGLLAALFNFVPNFGVIFTLVPAALLALTISPVLVLWVLALYVVVQAIEGQVLQPLIQGRAADIPPALLLITQILIAFLAGPMGVILATPLMAVVLVLVRRVYIEQTLGGSA